MLGLVFPILRGWDSTGHKTVAKIASSLLSRKTARFVNDHLKGELANRGQIITRMRRIDYTMVKASSWADYVAATDPSMEWSKDLHFAHTPYRNCQPFDHERDCGFDEASKGRCIVTAIANYTERASDNLLTKEQRAEAIKFLIHLMADIHQPLHLGFAKDFGGNALYVMFRSQETNLHEVWDDLLLADLITSSGVSGYRELADELMLKGATREEFRIDPDDPLTMASTIATDTILSYTCGKGYKDNGEWVEKSEILSEDYIQDRKRVVIGQLKKAGVRLAQLLEHVASEFYESEYESSMRSLPKIATGSATSNSFTPLWCDFDPEESVYELSDPMGPIDPSAVNDGDDEEVIEKGEPNTTTEAPETATTYFELTKEEKKRIRNRKDRERKSRKKGMIEGVHIPSLVLIKRLDTFMITYKEKVVSEEWMPENGILLYIEFKDSEGETTTRLFALDSEVFPGDEWSSPLLNAVFERLGAKFNGPRDLGAVTTYKEFSLTKGDRGDMFGDMNQRSDTVIRFGELDFSSIEKAIFKTPSKEYLEKNYGADSDNIERYECDYVQDHMDEFMLIPLGKLVFLTRFDQLDKNPGKDRFIVTWIPVDATLEETSGGIPTDSIYLLVDNEAFDGSAFRESHEMIIRYRALNPTGTSERFKTFMQPGRYPLIFEVLEYLDDYRVNPSDQEAFKNLNDRVIAVNRITRNHWVFKMDEIVLRK